MLDTVRVKFPISPDPEQLQYWTHKTTSTESHGLREYYLYNPTINNDGVMLKYTYYPLGYDTNPLLTIECSLPKLIYGNNYQMLLSIDRSIEAANIKLASVPHAPILDLAEGVLIRLDMCYNHKVGETVDDYLKPLSNLDYPHRRTKYHRGEGVEFKAKNITTKFYNKQRETGLVEAFGILRQETTIMNGKAIQNILGVKKPTLLNVSRDFITDYLNQDLKKLALFENSIGTRSTVLKMLCVAYGSDAGFCYYGILLSKMDRSRKQLAQESKTHPRSLDRRLRKIIDAKIPLTITDREEPLPPLIISL
jgi:hypothetical protein